MRLDLSERTVARRYQRLRGLGLRIVGQPDPARLGLVRWLLRLHCTPDAAGDHRRSPGAPSRHQLGHPRLRRHRALLRRQHPYGRRTQRPAAAKAPPHPACALRQRPLHDEDLRRRHQHLARHPLPPRHPRLPRGGFRHPRTPLALDETDRTLFTELARHGRATLPELSKATGRSPSSVQRHLDRLRTEGALHLSVDFDPQLLGYHMSTQLWLNVAPAHLRTVGETLATHPAIAFAAAITGTSNLVASGVFRSPADLYDYIDGQIGPLPGIQSIETAPTLREVKRLAPALP